MMPALPSRPAARRLAPLLLVLALFPGCAGAGRKPEWVSAQVPAASDSVLWEVTRIALETQRFHVLTSGFDPVTRSTQSAWQMDMHPFKGEGYRERVHVSYEPAGPGQLELSVRVEHEINNNIARPMDPQYANWKQEADNPQRARVILRQIQVRLGGGSAGGAGR